MDREAKRIELLRELTSEEVMGSAAASALGRKLSDILADLYARIEPSTEAGPQRTGEGVQANPLGCTCPPGAINPRDRCPCCTAIRCLAAVKEHVVSVCNELFPSELREPKNWQDALEAMRKHHRRHKRDMEAVKREARDEGVEDGWNEGRKAAFDELLKYLETAEPSGNSKVDLAIVMWARGRRLACDASAPSPAHDPRRTGGETASELRNRLGFSPLSEQEKRENFAANTGQPAPPAAESGKALVHVAINRAFETLRLDHLTDAAKDVLRLASASDQRAAVARTREESAGRVAELEAQIKRQDQATLDIVRDLRIRVGGVERERDEARAHVAHLTAELRDERAESARLRADYQALLRDYGTRHGDDAAEL